MCRRPSHLLCVMLAVVLTGPLATLGCDDDEETPENDTLTGTDTSAPDDTDDDTGDTGTTDADTTTSGECPAAEPLPGGACQAVGRCEYGMECCGESCGPTYVCECNGTLATSCLNTDIGLCAPDMTDTADTAGGSCRSDADCTDPNETCARADSNVCGTCQQGMPCDDDSGCAGGEVCSNRMTLCPCGTETVCAPACATADDCPRSGDVCDTDGHCKPEPCAADTDCTTPQFVCDTAAGQCTRADCTADADCPAGGVCVNGQCAESEGVCLPPVP